MSLQSVGGSAWHKKTTGNSNESASIILLFDNVFVPNPNVNVRKAVSPRVIYFPASMNDAPLYKSDSAIAFVFGCLRPGGFFFF